MRKLKEKILLSRIKIKKDPDAFAEIYDFYLNKIYRFIYLKVSSVEEAEDLTSETFLKVWQYINGVQEINNLNALLYRIARNCVIDYYRKRAKKEIIAEDYILKNIPDDRKDIAHKVLLDSDLREIEKHLRQLKDEYREVIILRFIDELSIKEIAEVLDKSKGAVRVLIHRALKNLREMTQKTVK